MRKIIFQVMVSLDGFFETTDGDNSWHNVDQEFKDYSIDVLANADTLIFGRKTFEVMAAYWPTEAAIKTDPEIAERMNSLPKIVFSKTLQNSTWNNTRFINSNIETTLLELKKERGEDIVLFGSSNLATSLIDNNLIDEARIIINPVFLGSGITLLSGLTKPFNFKLEKTTTFNSGKVMLCYKLNN